MTPRFRAILVFGGCLAAVAWIGLAGRPSDAQRTPARVNRVRAHRRGGQDEKTPSNAIHFGDILLHGFADADIDLPGGKAQFTGPNTTVDATDPKQQEATSRLRAR